MQRQRLLQCLGLIAGSCLGATALGQYAVSLETAGTCNNTGNVIVNVKLASAPMTSTAAGAQLFLSFANANLTASSISPGAGLQNIVSSFNQGTGTINIAVGVTAPNQVIAAGDTIATLVFTSSGTVCSTSNLVAFRSNTPPSRLTDNAAQSLGFTTSNLGAITLNDLTAPSITGGPVLSAINANADTGQCSATISVSAPAATDNCTVSSVTGARSDMAALNAPYPVGTTTITWTATDGCGSTSTATQAVVVTDTQAPSITCGSDITVSNDLNNCSAIVAVTAPGASDNCGIQSVVGVRDDFAALNAAYPIGVTTITWTATDVNGLTAQCVHTVTVNDTQAPIVTAPSAITSNADAGACTLTLSAAQLGSASVGDNCPGPYGTPIASLTLNGPAIILPYAFPTGPTTVFWRATDAYSNVGQATQTVTVNAFNTVTANVELLGVSSGSFTRCVDFKLYTAGPCALAHSVSADVNFVNGSGTVTFNVPCGSALTASTATDPKHTLRRTSTVSVSGNSFVTNFIGASGLTGGNVNNDEFIDILDFGGYIGQFGPTNIGVSTLCGASGLHADFSGNGTVGLEDFTFISFSFLASRDLDPCGGLLQRGPVTDVSVADLLAAGLTTYVAADRNMDWRVNAADVSIVLTSGLSTCTADFNGNRAADTQDIFDYLNGWFTGHPRCDVDALPGVATSDLFSFLNAWFAGC